MQASRLVYKMKDESKGVTEGVTRKRLREKIATLPQPRLASAMDALLMIWNEVKEPSELPTAQLGFTSPATPTLFPNEHRVKLALLKSISTGTFIDVQFYAYNAIGNGLPLHPRPLFTSSIAIEEWGAEIATRE